MSPPEDAEIERLRAVQRALVKLATTTEAPADGPAALVAWGVHGDDAAALGAFSRERTGVYGGLVGRTVHTAYCKQLPRTAARLPPEALQSALERFLAEQAPRSPYLRDVAFELTMFAAPQWARDASVPPHVPDLARYELLLFAAGAAESGPRPAAPEPLAPDRGVWLDGTVHLGRFRHAVHTVPEDPADATEPERAETALIVYRDADNETQTVEVTLEAMEIFERLIAGAPLGRAIVEGAAALGRGVDAAWIEGISGLLAELAERGALLGAAPAGAASFASADSSPYRDWLSRGEPKEE